MSRATFRLSLSYPLRAYAYLRTQQHPSIITGVHLLCSNGQMHFQPVALSEIDLCASCGTSGPSFPKAQGAEGQKLSTPLTKTLAITTHSQLTGHGHSTGLRAPAAAVIKVSSHKYSCAFNDPTSLHSAWIMNMMRKLRGQSRGGGNGDGVEATSKYPASVAILVLSSPKVNKEGERGQWRHILELVA